MRNFMPLFTCNASARALDSRRALKQLQAPLSLERVGRADLNAGGRDEADLELHKWGIGTCSQWEFRVMSFNEM